MYNDEDEVESVMEERHDIKRLMKMIENDPSTVYAGHNASGDAMSRMKVTDLKAFIADVQESIEALNDYSEISDDFDDDDDVDDDDSEEFDDDDDIDVTDYPDIEDSHTNTDDIDQMFDELESIDDGVSSKVTSTTVKSTTITVEDDSTDTMTVHVIHRRS